MVTPLCAAQTKSATPDRQSTEQVFKWEGEAGAQVTTQNVVRGNVMD